MLSKGYLFLVESDTDLSSKLRLLHSNFLFSVTCVVPCESDCTEYYASKSVCNKVRCKEEERSQVFM